MQLAAKWRDSWAIHSERIEGKRVHAHFLGDEPVEVIRLGRGDPIVVIPGLAGGWKLLWPLVRDLARHFEVITFGLRGDDRTWDDTGAAGARIREIGEYAQDVVCLIDQLGIESPAVLGVSFGGAIALELAAEYPGSTRCLDAPWSRSAVPPDDRLENCASRSRAVSASERQSIHQPVFSPAFRYQARAGAAG